MCVCEREAERERQTVRERQRERQTAHEWMCIHLVKGYERREEGPQIRKILKRVHVEPGIKCKTYHDLQKEAAYVLCSDAAFSRHSQSWVL